MFNFANKIFGHDPRLEFKQSSNGISKLLTRTIDPKDAYWTQFFTLFESNADVVTLLDSHTLTLALHQSSQNLLTLVRILASHLNHLLSIPTFPLSAQGSDLSREALNCVRVLSRVVPVIAGEAGLEQDIFWTRERVQVRQEHKVDEEGEGGQFVLEDEDDEDLPATTATAPPAEEFTELPPLAETLLRTLVELAFVAGFTVAEECRNGEGGPVAHVIWEPGIASAPSSLPPTPHHILSNRLELVRLLSILVALPSLQTPAHLFPVVPNLWRSALVVGGQTLERKVILCFLCSLLNQAFAAGRAPPPREGGMLGGITAAAAGRLGEAMLRREDVKGLLTGACLQLLGTLLIQHGAPEASAPEPNAFEHYLAKLHRTSDFDFILAGVSAILTSALNPPLIPGVVSSSSAVGGSKGGWATEALVVLWRALEGNVKLRKYVAESEGGADLVVYLLSFALELKDDETQLGLVRLCSYMLQSLTTEPALADKLNGPVRLTPSARAKFGVPGSLADFLIVSVYTLIFSTKAKLANLYPSLILAITNVSQHVKALGPLASQRLVQLFLAFSAPNFVLMEEGNPRLVFYLLETFNSIIHYQLSDNPHLIYGIIRSSQRFEALSTFTLAGGVAEVRRARQERKAATASASMPSSAVTSSRLTPSSTRTSINLPSAEDAAEKEAEATAEGEGAAEEPSEKVRGKMRARSSSGGSRLPPVAEQALAGAHDEILEGGAFVGKHGFTPTEAWVSSWREGLPLDTIQILLAELQPKVVSATQNASGDSTTAAVSLLRSASLAGLLPPSTPVKLRPFAFSPQSVTWLGSIVYGSVFLSCLELLRDVQVRLFGVAQARRTATAGELFTGAARLVGLGGQQPAGAGALNSSR